MALPYLLMPALMRSLPAFAGSAGDVKLQTMKPEVPEDIFEEKTSRTVAAAGERDRSLKHG